MSLTPDTPVQVVAALPEPVQDAPLPPAVAALPETRRKFAEHYAMYGKVVPASVFAGVSESTAFRLLRSLAVQEAIAYYIAEYARVSAFTPLKIMRELAAMADINVSDLFNEDWTLRPKSSIPKALQRAMVGLEVQHTKYGLRIKPRFAKLEALQELARILGMTTRDTTDEPVAAGTTVQITMHAGTRGESPLTAVQVGPLSILPAEE